MERLLAPHGPYGRVLRPSDGKSRIRRLRAMCGLARPRACGVPYCSRVCCMYAIKQAMLLSGSLPTADITIYYMDIRALRQRLRAVLQNAQRHGHPICQSEGGRDHRETPSTTSSVHIEASGGRLRAAEQVSTTWWYCRRASCPAATPPRCARLGVGLRVRLRGGNRLGCERPRRPSRPGPACSPPAWPRVRSNIPDSVVDAGAAAMEAVNYMRKPGWTRRVEASEVAAGANPKTRAEPRVAVYVCHCGGNISGRRGRQSSSPPRWPSGTPASSLRAGI